MLGDNFNFKLFSSSGRFAVERHEENSKDKGDGDSVKQRQKTVETLGVRPRLRNPPWPVQHPTLGVDDELLSVHGRTLFDATQRAWQSDTHRTNRVVQVTLATPIPEARLYKRDLPSDAARCKISRGPWKLLEQRIHINEHSRDVAFDRDRRSSASIRKEALNWTLSSRGAAGFTHRKFEVANDLFRGR